MDTTHSLQRGRPGWKETSHINIQGQKLPMSTMGFAAGTTPFADEKSMTDAGMLDPATDQLTDKGVHFYKQWRKNQIRKKTILKHIEDPDTADPARPPLAASDEYELGDWAERRQRRAALKVAPKKAD